LRILNAFNLAQDAYNVTQAMRSRNIDADLLITSRESSVFSIPLWEEGTVDEKLFGDPLSPNPQIVKNFRMPEWVKVVDVKLRHPVFNSLELLPKLYPIFKKYDIVFAHFPGSMFAMLCNCNYVPYDEGMIRYFPFSENPLPPHKKKRLYITISYSLLKKSYEKADIILFTNPDTIHIFEKANLKTQFVPFAIPCDRYRPGPKRGLFKDYELVFFMPSRQHWVEKGNDRVIKAYKKFLLHNPNSLLIMVSWGTDVLASKGLIKELGIPSRNIRLVEPMSKNNLVRMYNEADVILDQFTLGCWGTTTPEAMACEKPVIMYYDEAAIRRCFGSLPPVLNAHKPEEIWSKMEMCQDSNLRYKCGEQGREWVKRTHDPSLVVDIHLKVAEKVLEKKM